MTPFQDGVGRHYLAAITTAAIGVDIAQARTLKMLSDAISGTLNATLEVPTVDALVIRGADFVTTGFADMVTSIGLAAMLAVFVLAISRGKVATLALCAIAATFAIFGSSLISSSLQAFVPLFAAMAVPATDAPTAAAMFSLPAAVGAGISLSVSALTLTIAFLMAIGSKAPQPASA